MPASYEGRGSELVIHVDHQNQDVRYPILVDPYVVENYRGADFQYPGASLSSWVYQESIPPFGGSLNGSAPTTGTGLTLSMSAGSYYPSGSFAQWVWPAPPSTQIVRTDFLHVAHPLNWSIVQLGITNGFSWQGNPHPPDNISNAPYTITDNQTDTYRTICTDAPHPCASGGASDGNAAVFRFQSTGGGNPRVNSNTAAMGQAQMSLRSRKGSPPPACPGRFRPRARLGPPGASTAASS